MTQAVKYRALAAVWLFYAVPRVWIDGSLTDVSLRKAIEARGDIGQHCRH